jgi:hypothetical protein
MPKDEGKERKRIVVEEVSTKEAEMPEPKISEEGASTNAPFENESVLTEKEPESSKETPEFIPAKKSGSPALWIIIPGIFLLGALLGGIVFYQRGVNKGQTEPIPTETPSEVNPTPTPSAEVDLEKYSVSVLNGSGIPGEAGKAKDLLVTAGFKVGSTGNASTYDFTKTIIRAKEGVDAAYVTKLSETLGEVYVVGKNETLPESSKDEVQVVVGSSKAE